jgi:hypothetical protein
MMLEPKICGLTRLSKPNRVAIATAALAFVILHCGDRD